VRRIPLELEMIVWSPDDNLLCRCSFVHDWIVGILTRVR